MEPNQRIQITKDYKVIVGCMTYNHSKYIADALNGFAIQKTNFPFACIVMDDASTDGEPEVIKDWLQKECHMEQAEYYDQELANVIIVPHRTNANCTMAVYFLKRNLFKEGNLKLELVKDWGLHCEYIACCDGDDYWTSPNKLQKQADCLDINRDINICLHGYLMKDADVSHSIRELSYSKDECVIPLKKIIVKSEYGPAAGSIFIRANLFRNVPDFVISFTFDYSILIYGAINNGAYYIPDLMSVYRINVKSSEMTKVNSDFEYRKSFNEKRIKMLLILDKDLNYEYHQEILASILLANVSCSNTPFVNFKYACQYYGGFKCLPPLSRIKVICKCICPKFGHWVMSKLHGRI